MKSYDIMTREPKLIQTGSLASEALKKMEQYHIIAMPVVDKAKKLLGVVHIHDILNMAIKV